MSMILIGVNHNTAPIAIRENFFLTPIQQDLFLSRLDSHYAIAEAFVISTCNRTEICLRVLEDEYNPDQVVQEILKIKELEFTRETMSHFYIYRDEAALEHLLRVVTGLDSLVIGEKQILGQLKGSIERAQERGMFSKKFNVLSNIIIRAGKKAQSETEIGFGGSSVSWAAIAQAEQKMGDLKNKKVLFIGAGEMSKLAVGQVSNRGFNKLYVMNRTHKHAQDLAEQFNGEAVAFCDIKEILSDVDFCICSSSAPHYILDAETVRKTMELRDNRRLLLIDISMPRNVDPDVGEVNNVDLYDIDDLQSVVQANLNRRQNARVDVENIIEEKMAEYAFKMEKIHLYSL